jgi:hypothetical protein
MPKLSKEYADILKSFGEDEKTALWDCHGTWVIYHKALERIAAKADIRFDPPQIIESDSVKWAVSICATGYLGERSEWSIGEASQHNYKTKGSQPAYPWAIAEKRAKDRVILKLCNLSGVIYSEEEADDFKAKAPGGPREGAGSAPEERQFEVIDQFGNVEDVMPTAMGFITTLATLVKDDGNWWANNKETVTWINKNSEKGSDVKKQSRLLWTLGEEAASNVT